VARSNEIESCRSGPVRIKKRVHALTNLCKFSTLIGLATCEINFELRDIEQFVERPAFCAHIDYKRLPNATVRLFLLRIENLILFSGSYHCAE